MTKWLKSLPETIQYVLLFLSLLNAILGTLVFWFWVAEKVLQ